MRIGYLIPEFPGQTHNFFWRERIELIRMGAEVDMVSTKRPASGLISPEWARTAMENTTYLFPVGLGELREIIAFLLVTDYRKIANLAKIIFSADDLRWFGRIKLFALSIISVRVVLLARKRGWAHLHVHSCGDSLNVALFANRLSGLPYSLTLHNPLSTFGGNQKNKWKYSEFAVVITKTLRDEVQSKLAGSIPPRLDVAPMGVNLDVFKRMSAYKPYSGEGQVRLFSCGRLNPCKGFLVLIESVAILKKIGLPVSLKIAGEDDSGGTGFRCVVENAIRSYNLSDSVELLGALPESGIVQNLSQSHIFILASLEEPLGVVIMEAMAMEVPVIATDAGGVPELIERDVDGILIKPGDAEEISNAVLKLISNSEIAIKLSRASRSKIANGFHSALSAEIIFRNISRPLT